MPEEGIRNLLRTVGNDETILDLVKVADENGGTMKLVLSRRPVKPVPKPSPKRSHMFHSVSSFIAYLARYGGENTVIFGDATARVMCAVLDEMAPDGFECVRFTAPLHPFLAPWSVALGQSPMELKWFHDFICKNREVIVSPDARELLFALRRVRASKDVRIFEGHGQGSESGILMRTQVRAGQKNGEGVIELPETIGISVPVYVGTAQVPITFNLLWGVTDDKVWVSMTSSMLSVLRVEAFESMLAEVRESAELKAKGVVVTLGSPGHEQRDYLNAEL